MAKYRSSRIYYKGKDHVEAVYNNVKHKAMAMFNSACKGVVWKKIFKQKCLFCIVPDYTFYPSILYPNEKCVESYNNSYGGMNVSNVKVDNGIAFGVWYGTTRMCLTYDAKVWHLGYDGTDYISRNCLLESTGDFKTSRFGIVYTGGAVETITWDDETEDWAVTSHPSVGTSANPCALALNYNPTRIFVSNSIVSKFVTLDGQIDPPNFVDYDISTVLADGSISQWTLKFPKGYSNIWQFAEDKFVATHTYGYSEGMHKAIAVWEGGSGETCSTGGSKSIEYYEYGGNTTLKGVMVADDDVYIFAVRTLYERAYDGTNWYWAKQFKGVQIFKYDTVLSIVGWMPSYIDYEIIYPSYPYKYLRVVTRDDASFDPPDSETLMARADYYAYDWWSMTQCVESENGSVKNSTLATNSRVIATNGIEFEAILTDTINCTGAYAYPANSTTNDIQNYE